MPPTGLCYNAHVANVGWQGWRCNGQLAGNGTGQIEAVAVAEYSSNTGVSEISAQAYLGSVGWTTVATGSGLMWLGTTGQNKRLEALAIQYTPYLTGGRMCGRAYLQGTGWQNEQHSNTVALHNDIMTLGTWGQARAIYYIWLNVDC